MHTVLFVCLSSIVKINIKHHQHTSVQAVLYQLKEKTLAYQSFTTETQRKHTGIIFTACLFWCSQLGGKCNSVEVGFSFLKIEANTNLGCLIVY